MNPAICQLAETLGIDTIDASQTDIANLVAIRVLHNIHEATRADTQALEWNAGMTYTGIGGDALAVEIDQMMQYGITPDDLHSICNRIDDVLKASRKLYAEIQRFTPGKMYQTPLYSILKPTAQGFGGAISRLHQTHATFEGGCKSTVARIRAHLKRKEAIEAEQAQDAYEKSTMHQQMGMGL